MINRKPRDFYLKRGAIKNQVMSLVYGDTLYYIWKEGAFIKYIYRSSNLKSFVVQTKNRVFTTKRFDSWKSIDCPHSHGESLIPTYFSSETEIRRDEKGKECENPFFHLKINSW